MSTTNQPLTSIGKTLDRFFTSPKPVAKRVDWSGKVKRLVKKHPELEIRIEHWDKNEYGNWYYIHMRSDIEEKIEDEHFGGMELQECCNNMQGVFDQLVARLDWLKEEGR